MEMDLDRPTSLILKVCERDGKSNAGTFQWPREGYVEPDGYDNWDPHDPPWWVQQDNTHFSRGLYGFLNGEGDRSYIPYSARGNGGVWVVAETYTDQILKCTGKVKFPYAWVVGWYNSEHEAMQVIRSGEGVQHRLREQKTEKERQRQEEEHQAWLEEQDRLARKQAEQERRQQEEEHRPSQVTSSANAQSQVTPQDVERVIGRSAERPVEAQQPVYVAQAVSTPVQRQQPVYAAPAQPRRQRMPEPTYQGMTDTDRVILGILMAVMLWTLRLMGKILLASVRLVGRMILASLRKFVSLAKPPAPRVRVVMVQPTQEEFILGVLTQAKQLAESRARQIGVTEQPAYWVLTNLPQEVDKSQ